MDRYEVERMSHAIHMIMHWAVLAWQAVPYPPHQPNQVVNLFAPGNDDDFGPDIPVAIRGGRVAAPKAKANAKAKPKTNAKAKAKANAKVNAKAKIGKDIGGDKPDGRGGGGDKPDDRGGGGGNKRDGRNGKKAVKMS